MVALMGGSSRPTSSNSQGRRSRSQSRSRSRAASETDPAEANGHSSSTNVVAGNTDPTMDFCNNFWSHGEQTENGGSGQEAAYDALMSKMKASGKMVDDFRAFFKERAAIEEDYARRLAKLARQPLGRDETGDFAAVLKRLQYELDQTGRCHNELASVIRISLESRIKEFESNRDIRRKNMQYLIEKSWKNKQAQEIAVQKALEKYKSDCILINSFSARLSLTQGRDMDKVTAKLDKVQQTVQINETEYRNYLKALNDTNAKWVSDWKAWCDLCQDLEEERIDFTRNALWSYVNALSLLCVKDDESCENVRQTIELCDVGREIQTYVQRDGGAGFITESPYFVDFSDGDKGEAAPASHPANFKRSSAKIEIAAFDSLERLQALIYPQQGQQRRSVAGTPAPTASQPTSAAALTPAHSGAAADQTPQRSGATQPAQDVTPQAPLPSLPAALASPTKRDIEASLPSKAESQPLVPPAAFSASTAARSRPSSRAGPSEDKTGDLTTAEKLQYQASQKRISAGAFKASGDRPGASPHYPYASASPRAAKPYEPPAPGSEAEQALKQSTSGVLPPPSTAPSGPIAPSAIKEKKEEDPLLAALAKLRNPSSAVDVLPPTSPGVPGGIGPGAVSLPGMARAAQGQPPRSHSPYGQQPQAGQPLPRSHSPYASAANARSNPNMHSYSRPVSMTPSQSQPGPMYAQQARSRPVSPQPPMQAGPPQDIARAPSPAAAMMRPPSQPHAGPDAASTVSSYGQSFPGERRQSISVPKPHASQSRPASPGAGLMSPSGVQGGYAGIGSQTGRSSPARGYPGQAHQQYQQGMRSPSPAPQPGYGQPQQQPAGYGQPQQRPGSAYDPQRMSQPPPSTGHGHGHSNSLSGPGGPPGQQQQGRPTTPLGINLDARGSVTTDHMAERYQQQRQQAISPGPHSQGGPASPYGGHPQASLPPSQQSAGYRRGASIYQQAQNRQNMVASPSQPAMHPTQPMSPPYGYSPAAGRASPAPPASAPGYGGYQQQAQPQQRGPQSPYAPSPAVTAGQLQQRPSSQNINRSQSMGYAPQQQAVSPGPQQMATSQSYRGNPSQYAQQGAPQQQGYSQSQPPPAQQQPSYGYSQPPPAQQYQQPPSAAQQQAPSNATQQPLQAPPTHHMPPTGQYTETGQPILFYVKAIYKYDAASAEEFSFQKDDVIGVYETDDDGWWKGELLDPDRARRSGGNLFPSNFTAFLD